jgi:TolB-like protein
VGYRTKLCGVAFTLGVGFGLAAQANMRAPSFEEPPTLAVVPFRNLTGQSEAVPAVMNEVWRVLQDKGFVLAGNGRIDDFLRSRRIRARNALSNNELREIARFMNVRYVLEGTIDVWFVNGGPEIGLMARIVDPDSGALQWGGSVSLHAVQAPGLLARGRPKTLEEAVPKAVRRLFHSLKLRQDNGDVSVAKKRRRAKRSLLADRPVHFRDSRLDTRPRLRVAVLPMTNMTRHPEAAAVVSEHVQAWLLALTDVEVIDPGELRRALIDHDILPLSGVTSVQLARLGDALGVDAVLDGAVLNYENGIRTRPLIDVYARLRDADSGQVLWAATTRRHGEQTRTLFDLGRIQGIDRLAEAAVGDLLSTWLR